MHQRATLPPQLFPRDPCVLCVPACTRRYFSSKHQPGPFDVYATADRAGVVGDQAASLSGVGRASSRKDLGDRNAQSRTSRLRHLGTGLGRLRSTREPPAPTSCRKTSSHSQTRKASTVSPGRLLRALTAHRQILLTGVCLRLSFHSWSIPSASALRSASDKILGTSTSLATP